MLLARGRWQGWRCRGEQSGRTAALCRRKRAFRFVDECSWSRFLHGRAAARCVEMAPRGSCVCDLAGGHLSARRGTDRDALFCAVLNLRNIVILHLYTSHNAPHSPPTPGPRTHTTTSGAAPPPRAPPFAYAYGASVGCAYPTVRLVARSTRRLRRATGHAPPQAVTYLYPYIYVSSVLAHPRSAPHTHDTMRCDNPHARFV